MNKQCEIVQDLLPLYVDKVCSQASAQMVEEHLPECADCTEVYNNLKKDACENSLKEEAESVIKHHVKSQKKKTLMVGICIAGVLCIPLVVCLIVNLAVGHALDWFFIVLTSLMVCASLVVVPLVAEKHAALYTMFCFTVSLILLLMTCAIYSNGDWFWVVTSSVLFGLSVIFIPYIAYKAPLNAFWKRNKGLFILGTTTTLLFVMMFCIGIFVASYEYWRIASPITLFFVGVVWLVFLICRYLKVSKCIRAGLASIISGGVLFSANNVINYFIGEDLPWPKLNLNTWNIDTVDGNTKWLMLIAGVAVGIVLILIGIARKGKKNNK